LDLPVLKKGSFYYIKDGDSDIIMEDKTKRGLTIKETSIDEKLNVKADKGMIHDMDGIGHWVPIRWYFSKSQFDLNQVSEYAEAMDKKYTALKPNVITPKRSSLVNGSPYCKAWGISFTWFQIRTLQITTQSRRSR
jgi:hypothetical protein